MNPRMSANMDMYMILNSFAYMLIPGLISGVSAGVFKYLGELISWVSKWYNNEYIYNLEYTKQYGYFNGKEELHKALKHYVSNLDIVSNNTEINLDPALIRPGRIDDG